MLVLTTMAAEFGWAVGSLNMSVARIGWFRSFGDCGLCRCLHKRDNSACNGLTFGGGKFMALDVVVTTAGDQAYRWSRQYCRQVPWTVTAATSANISGGRNRNLVTVNPVSRASVVNAITRAASLAGRGGRVLYNIGHGNGSRAGANVMFAPGGQFTVSSEIVAGNRTINMGIATNTVCLTPDETDIRNHFLQIGTALQRSGVTEFVFIVCGLGGNQNFLRQIKTAWGGLLTISAYNDGVALEDDILQGDHTYPRTRLYLYRDGAVDRARLGTGTSAIPMSWLEIPSGLVTV